MFPINLLFQPDAPVELLDMVDLLLRFVTMAIALVPVAEVRKALGRLPDIPLPGGNKIRAGRWFSFAIGIPIVLYGHAIGILIRPDFANITLWMTGEWLVITVIANAIYSGLWKERLGMDNPQVVIPVAPTAPEPQTPTSGPPLTR